ncbi:MAG TPA: hypothetical protein VFG21_04700 [Xanthomonadaceae bacterium]|nr:hypothetical protein [Xanthomonadaceae bacterium]
MYRIALVALLAAFSGNAAAKQDIDKVNGSIRAEAGQEYGSLETVNGSIRVEAEASADSVETVNGSVRVDSGARLGSVETVNGGIRLDEGVVVSRSVETVNGGIDIGRASRVDGEVSTVNGRIELLQAELGAGIQTVNGDITVGEGSTVRGGIVVEKPKGWFQWGKQRAPRIVIGPNAVVEGELRFEREVELFVHASAKVGRISGADAKSYSGATP